MFPSWISIPILNVDQQSRSENESIWLQIHSSAKWYFFQSYNFCLYTSSSVAEPPLFWVAIWPTQAQTKLDPGSSMRLSLLFSVAHPEWFIPSQNPAHHADADQVYLEKKKKLYNLIKKKILSTICHHLFHTIQSYSTNSQEFTVLFICSFTFCWIWIQNNNSGSRQKFWIHVDPDPQHCFYWIIFTFINCF